MARARTLVLRNKVEVTGAEKLKGLGDRLSGVGTKLSIGLTAPIALLGKTALDVASEAEQATGAMESVFGNASGAIEDFAKTSAQSFGIASRDAKQFGALIGSQLQSFGFSADEAAQKSVELQKRAADMAAMFGGTVPEAVQAISSALRGEFNPIERYAVNLRQADIDARAMALGLDTSTASAQKQARATAALDLIFQQSARSAGQFAREGDTLSGQQARLSAQFTDLQEQLGRKLLPIMVSITTAVTGLVEGFSSLPDEVQTGILIFAGFAAALGPVVLIVGNLIKAVGGLQIAMAAIKTASPQVVSAITGAFTGITSAIGSAISAAASAARSVVVGVATTLGSAFNAAFQLAVGVMRGLATVIGAGLSSVASAARGVITTAASALGAVFSAAFNAAAAVFAPLGSAISGLATTVRAAVVAAASALGAAFSAAFNLAASAADALIGGLTTALNGAKSLIGRTGTALGAVFGAAFAVATDVAGFVADWVGSLWKLAIDDVRNRGAFLGGIFGGAFSVGAKAVEVITTFASTLLAAGKKKLLAVALTLAIEFNAAFTAAAAAFAPAAAAIGAAINLMLGPIGLVIAAVGLLATAFATDFLGIRSTVSGFVDDMALNFGDMGDRLHSTADEMGITFDELKEQVKDRMAETGESFEEAITHIEDEARAASVEIPERMEEGMRATHQVVRDIGAEIKADWEGVADHIPEYLAAEWDKVHDAAFDLMEAHAQGILDNQTAPQDAFNKAMDLLETEMSRAEEVALLKGQLLTLAHARGVASAEGKEATVAAIDTATAEIGQRLSQLGVEAYNWGTTIPSNLAAGIWAASPKVLDSVTGAVPALARGIRGQMPGSEPKDPNSPLRGITKAWGFADTLADALRAGVPKLQSAARAAAGALVPSLTAPSLSSVASLRVAPVPGGLGGPAVVYNFYIQWDGERPQGRSEAEIVSNLQRLSPLMGGRLAPGYG